MGLSADQRAELQTWGALTRARIGQAQREAVQLTSCGFAQQVRPA